MKIRHQLVDVSGVNGDEVVSAMMDRTPGVWHVLEGPATEPKLGWTHVSQGDYVPVYLVPYILPDVPAAAFVAVAQITANVLGKAPRKFSEFVIVAGDPVAWTGEDGSSLMRLWLGFAGRE